MQKLIELLQDVFEAGQDYQQACIDNGMNGGLGKVFYEPDLPDMYGIINQKQKEIAMAIKELFDKPLYLHEYRGKELITDSPDFPSKELGLVEFENNQYNCKPLTKI